MDTGVSQRGHLFGCGSLPARNDCSGMAHAPARRRRLSGDKSNDWFRHILFGKRRGFFFSRAADLTDHHDAVGFIVVLKQSQCVDVRRADNRIATYASGALRRGLKLEEAVTAAGRLREKGYRQAKMQLGLPGVTSPAREVEQARLIRETVGPEMDLMCDINQRWRVEQAIDIGRRVEDAGVGLFWLEDVTAHDDYPGLARVAAALATPIAGGEYLWALCQDNRMVRERGRG